MGGVVPPPLSPSPVPSPPHTLQPPHPSWCFPDAQRTPPSPRGGGRVTSATPTPPGTSIKVLGGLYLFKPHPRGVQGTHKGVGGSVFGANTIPWVSRTPTEVLGGLHFVQTPSQQHPGVSRTPIKVFGGGSVLVQTPSQGFPEHPQRCQEGLDFVQPPPSTTQGCPGHPPHWDHAVTQWGGSPFCPRSPLPAGGCWGAQLGGLGCPTLGFGMPSSGFLGCPTLGFRVPSSGVWGAQLWGFWGAHLWVFGCPSLGFWGAQLWVFGVPSTEQRGAQCWVKGFTQNPPNPAPQAPPFSPPPSPTHQAGSPRERVRPSFHGIMQKKKQTTPTKQPLPSSTPS
ncbi:protein diaphanous homolog 1-like [Manacus candei]|uniref:protein diaphanous homolog 1-like n=1 Tax=Manacus candei TaxID=415023 RepID=UPI002227368A|nr:protein diaphanous homolog 1-like [Manacus candei]